MKPIRVSANSLDIKAISPVNGAKYSPNLYAWLTKRSEPYRVTTSKVYADRDGVLFIGALDRDFLIGSRLMGVLVNGASESSWAFSDLGKLTELPQFWSRYVAVGRCAIDHEHQMHFIGDDMRWRIKGERRECLWCGNHKQRQRIWIETVHRSAWEPVKNPVSEQRR